MRQKLFLIIAIFTLHFSSSAQSIYINAVPHHSDCHSACDGSVAVAGNGGIAPYTYTWMPSGVNTSTLNNLCPGNYTVYVADVAASSASLVVTILEQSPNISLFYTQNGSCENSCNGNITVMPGGGGIAPFNYYLDNLPVTPLAINSNICPGTHTINVTDATNCSSNYFAYVSLYASSSLSTSILYTNTACGSCNGSALVTPNWNFTSFDWQPGGMTNDTVNNLCIGNHSVNITDTYGCSFTKTVNISNTGNSTAIPNFSATSSSYNETCFLTGDGAIDLSLSGTNIGPFNYLWSNGATSQDLINITSGIYWVAVTDGNSNCTLIKDTISSIGSNCGTISGNVFIDSFLNCYRYSNDTSLAGTTIIVNPGNRLGYSNMQGDYIINDLPNGTYTLTAQTNNWFYSATCLTSLNNISVNSIIPNQTNINIPVIPNSITLPDMYVWAYSTGFVPGFASRINYFLTNLTNANGNGLYKAILPTNVIPSITNISPSTYTISGDTIIWNFTNVHLYDNYHYYVDFTTPMNAIIGSTFYTCMYAQTSVNDYNNTNNNYCYTHLITGSFDPNDKTVSPVGDGTNGDIAATETDLTYLIRFQNTGNGHAVNIVVKDTLSPNVDVNTFEMLSSSHNYNIDILPGNVLRWKFNNIMLADSGSNEAASHGYIQYRIKPTNNNTPGTQIKNTAYIYFDFNAPVITNTAINTIETVTSVKSQSTNENGWNIYPNPSTGALYIVNSTSVKEESQIQVLNAIGQTVFEENISSNYKNIDLSKLTNGIYFVKITSDKSSTVKRVVLSK